MPRRGVPFHRGGVEVACQKHKQRQRCQGENPVMRKDRVVAPAHTSIVLLVILLGSVPSFLGESAQGASHFISVIDSSRHLFDLPFRTIAVATHRATVCKTNLALASQLR